MQLLQESALDSPFPGESRILGKQLHGKVWAVNWGVLPQVEEIMVSKIKSPAPRRKSFKATIIPVYVRPSE